MYHKSHTAVYARVHDGNLCCTIDTPNWLAYLLLEKMPIYRERYPDSWQEIARQVKEAAQWRCRHCGVQCLRPGEKPKEMTRKEWTTVTLSVHHANFTPEDNRRDNLIPLCSPCHIRLHTRRRSNTSPGQLELPL